MGLYGLIGRSLSHSFSKRYFEEKYGFNTGLHDDQYLNFELESVLALHDLILKYPDLAGFNVTIPYKKEILPLLHGISDDAKKIGSVNVVQVVRGSNPSEYTLIGHNTDFSGFTESISPYLEDCHRAALVLGTGGSSNAVLYALEKLGMNTLSVSRNGTGSRVITYANLDQSVLESHTVIVNTTPLGMWPDTESCPAVPIEFLNSKHLLFDLIYNPPATKLMRLSSQQGATVVNGYDMLCKQADQSLKIWKS